jgi:N-acetylmuramoyl-L-alanine amidase
MPARDTVPRFGALSRHAARALLAGCALAMVVLAWTPAHGAPPTARTLYEKAVGLDRRVRAAMSATAGQTPGVAAFRQAIDAYYRVVWNHPTSGYCDNALWQASQLAVEAFDRFGQDRDRLTALTYLRTLAREYPASGFVRRARASIQRLEHLAVAPSPASAPPPASRTRERARPATPASQRPPAPNASPIVVEQVQRVAAHGATTVVVHLGGPVAFKEETLANPPRVFFDLAGTRPSDAVKDAILTFDAGLVRQIRVGRHPNAVTRIVVDVDGVARHHAELLSDPHRLVITCWPSALNATPVSAGTVRPTPPAQTAAPAQPPLSAATAEPTPVLVAPTAPVTTSEKPVPAPPGPATASAEPQAPGGAPASPVAPPEGDPIAPPAAPSSNLQGGYSLARQLGLGASRIVIDAGHGGHDPGAMVGSRTEASITLDIALRLEKLLSKQPGIEVVLTRRTDVFVPLQERTEIANREGADLFVSIHVNASANSRARGIETYLLDFASDADAERVAARENASSLLTMSHLNDLVKRIALTTKADESRDLAVHVQRSMVRKLKPHNPQLRDLGVKRAPFVVLIGASMPSVLVEVAFLTHRQEAQLLANATYRERVAESLVDGIRRYQQALKKASPVALRRATPLAGSAEGQTSRDRIQ